ncbi:uncharacterized protein LOC26536249 [Drosophila yakuba]|uniref:Uncharacterized protein n=1 Tax=Drosophila yakuba TaxID=7245 RepID=A0A0R1DPH5_DROYA|nr:uncharacterized protein LOC26536249 [Drosophila yakuba]KRJ99112.1 uncharacterized protein Dyak_GE29068 [Drosophila yakuba]
MDVLLEEKESVNGSDPFAIQFPLPDHLDPSQCRDDFISTIIKEHERRVSSLRATLSCRGKSVFDSAVENEGRELERGAEAMVVRQMARMRKRESGRKTAQEAMESIKLRSSMMAELNIKCQKAAIEFLSVRLLKQLRLFSSPWPGKIDEIPYNLFKWSLDHFLARLEHNQLYLDVIHRERSVEDLNCVKFRTDLGEIENILHDMREDFQNDYDLCENSILLIRDCKYNTAGAWIKGLKDNCRIKEGMSNSSLAEESSISSLDIRQTALVDRFEDISSSDPIQVRYQIKWVNSCMDQRLMLTSSREELLRKELKELETKLKQDMTVQRSSEMIYFWEVEKLKIRTREWEAKLESDLENAEVQCTIARLALQKVKDDHKFYLEQEEMYLQKIDEFKKLMAAQEKVRRRKQAKEASAVEQQLRLSRR